MEATHPVWRSPAMRDALAQQDPGAVVRLVRRAQNVTLHDLGHAVGYTAASLSRMERGLQPMRDTALLRRVADHLTIPPQWLGLAAQHDDTRGYTLRHQAADTTVNAEPLGEEGEDPVQRRNLLAGMATTAAGMALGPAPASAQTVPPPSLNGLEDLLLQRHQPNPTAVGPTRQGVTEAVKASRHDFAACRYNTLARALPSRIALAQAFGADGHTEHAATAIAELYAVATRLCIKLGEDGLAAVTADRGLTAALGGADALTVAEAHRMVSSAWRRQGHHARATDIAVTAAQHLAASRTAPEAERLSIQGNLYATAAYTAAKHGDRHTAHTLITEAEATAGQLGRDDILRGSVFGPSQVRLHQISISYLLGDAGQAIDHARHIDASQLPTTERRARYWIDVARAFDQWRKPDRCFRALLAAEHAAPQEVRRSSVRSMTTHLMRHDRSLPGVRAFASRVGALT